MSPEIKKPSTTPYAALVIELENFVAAYVTYPDGGYKFVLALWTLATYMWPEFDAFPYVAITAATKRSGKTRCMEILSFVASHAKRLTGATAASMFRSLKQDPSVMFFDESEKMGSDAATDLRAVVNTGYRKGGSIERTGEKGKVETFLTYCPKVFVLIGDVTDTYRDRSIIVRMVRAQPPKRFLWETAESEGKELGERLQTAVADMKSIVRQVYGNADLFDSLSFLNDRDAEIWAPLFAVCTAFCPSRVVELTAVAADFATLKTAPSRKHSAVELQAAEDNAMEQEYAERLLADIFRVMGDYRYLWTEDLLAALFALPTGPWRRLRGTGITAVNIADMMKRFELRPKMIRSPGGRKHSKMLRGYTREDVVTAMRRYSAGEFGDHLTNAVPHMPPVTTKVKGKKFSK